MAPFTLFESAKNGGRATPELTLFLELAIRDKRLLFYSSKNKSNIPFSKGFWPTRALFRLSFNLNALFVDRVSYGTARDSKGLRNSICGLPNFMLP